VATQVGSDIELIVLNWLVKRGIAFQFENSLMGGFYELGGAVVDFLVEPNLAWRIMGEYWHRGVTKAGSDLIQKENLSAMGLVVVDIWSMDLETPERVNETLTKALQGIEMLR